MEIKIGVGMGKIVFGMSLKEVKNLLGEPNKISETEKENGVVLTYNEEMTKYKFDKDEDCRLYSIEVYNSEVIMFGKKVIGISKEQLINFLNENNFFDTVYEEYDFFETLFCEGIWTTFEFEFDRLRCIEFSPLYKNDDEIIWPKEQ